MNPDRSLIFAYLEEDNIQRAYFRVRPLLTMDGDVRQEAIQLWPNEGGLRIVPDRNEQHTFKIRMRTLGSFCVGDLRDQPAEAGKIRTNKNFRPDRGEVNQYILYSDTVHELPENTFYQLLDGAKTDHAALAAQAVTPRFYIRANDTLYGPVSKNAPETPDAAAEAMGMLYEIPCPDGVNRLILCMEDAPVKQESQVEPEKTPEAKDEKAAQAPVKDEAPAAEPAPDHVKAEAPENDAPLPIGESLKILDAAQNTDDTLKQLDQPVSDGANLLRQSNDKPVFQIASAPKRDELTGTRLVRTPLHVSVPQTKNKTQEVVSSQWNIGKYEPPAQNLPSGTTLHRVENPVESACQSLREAWNASSAHDQLTDFMLSLDGARSQLEVKLCNGGSVTIMQRVLRERLQDLEAERLTALCELDKAKCDIDAYKQELLTALSSRIARETGKLEEDRKTAETRVADLKSEINALTLQRDALLSKINQLQSDALPEAVAKLIADAQMVAPVQGIPLRISPVSGVSIATDELVSRLMNVCSASGVVISRNQAIAMLVLLAICPRIGVSSTTPAPVATLLKNITAAMGWTSSYAHQISAEQRPVVGLRPVDSTPAVLTTSLPNYAPVSGMCKVLLNRSTSSLIRNAAYDVAQWPVIMASALSYVAELRQDDVKPVSAETLNQLAEIPLIASAELNAVLTPILSAASPLSGSARNELDRFISICAKLMEGGLPVAVDWGILLWVIPALERGSRQYNAVKPLLDEYPLSLSKL